MTFREAGDGYVERLTEEGGKNIAIKRRQLAQHLIPFLGAKPLTDITTNDLERYKRQRKEKGAAAATINRELAVVSHLFSKALEWKWLAHKPARINRLKEENARDVYLTQEQLEGLLKSTGEDQNPHVYLFTKIGLETSMRKSEILSIRLDDIDVTRCMIFVPVAKNGKREQPITAGLADELRLHLELAEPGQTFLFPSARAKKGHTVNIDKPFRRSVAAAGLDTKEVVRHTLRHTAITHLVQAGVDLPTVQRISGHKTLHMVLRYAHQNNEHIRAALGKLEERYRNPKQPARRKRGTTIIEKEEAETEEDGGQGDGV